MYIIIIIILLYQFIIIIIFSIHLYAHIAMNLFGSEATRNKNLKIRHN